MGLNLKKWLVAYTLSGRIPPCDKWRSISAIVSVKYHLFFLVEGKGIYMPCILGEGHKLGDNCSHNVV